MVASFSIIHSEFLFPTDQLVTEETEEQDNQTCEEERLITFKFSRTDFLNYTLKRQLGILPSVRKKKFFRLLTLSNLKTTLLAQE